MSTQPSYAPKGERSLSQCIRRTLLALVLLLLVSGTVFLSNPSGVAQRAVSVWRVTSHNDDPPACRPADATVSVATSIINAVLQVVVVPAVEAQDNKAIIPEQEEDHIWVDNILLHSFQVNTLSVKTAAPDDNSLTVSARGFGLTVNETRFRYTYLGIRCYGHFTATLNETDIDTELGFTLLPESRWNATFSKLTFAWGTLDIQHALDSKACGMAQSVIELFTGQLDKYIATKVQKKLDEDGKNRATEELNKLFAETPIRALTPPIMTPDRLTVVLDATPSTLGCAPQPPVTVVPELLNRDVAVHTTSTDLNNILYNFASRNQLMWQDHLPDAMNTSLLSDVLPEVYEMCRDCPMYTQVKTSAAPVVVFLPTNTLTLTVRDVVVGLYVVPRTTQERDAMDVLLSDRASHASVYRRFGLQPGRTSSRLTDIPVLALSCTVTFGAKNLTFEHGRAMHYRLLKVHDFTVDVAASSIGDIDTAEIEQKGMEAWNELAVPLLNSYSPYKLPFFLRKAAMLMTLSKLDVGANIGFIEGLHAALERLFEL